MESLFKWWSLDLSLLNEWLCVIVILHVYLPDITWLLDLFSSSLNTKTNRERSQGCSFSIQRVPKKKTNLLSDNDIHWCLKESLEGLITETERNRMNSELDWIKLCNLFSKEDWLWDWIVFVYLLIPCCSITLPHLSVTWFETQGCSKPVQIV